MVKKRDYENLSAENIQKVKSLLNPTDGSKPITKKDACSILNISYNTARLSKIIEDFDERTAYVQLRKSQNRGKGATPQEIAEVIRDYLSGDSIATIAKSLYRSSGFVKSIVERVGIPSRGVSKEERSTVGYLPEECVAEEFAPGEIVWSARHHAPAEIEYEISVDYQAERPGFKDTNYEKKYGAKCYSIWVREDIDQDKEFWVSGIETGGFKAIALAYDLGSLRHLEKYGVDFSRL
jgi:hypothetical protein